MNNNVKQMVKCALLVGVVAILAQIKIDIVGFVPITMQTLGIYLVASILNPKYAFLAALVYVLSGAIGLPVFAGFTGGIGVLVGPTGGYLFSLPMMAYVISAILSFKKNTNYKIIAMVIGTLVCYIMGTAWFMYSTENTLMAALAWCVYPFLIGDILKVIVAIFFSNRINRIKQNK